MSATTPTAGGAMRPVRVFLVEDSPQLRSRICESLDAPGRIEVVGHSDSEREATAALAARAWDALVLDLRLRDGTGFGVLRALNAFRPAGRTVIVYTNYAIPNFREECAQLGADHVLDKSTDYDRLRALLDAMADARRPD
jgi:DNA-binding NarL/FixJ family response regulator